MSPVARRLSISCNFRNVEFKALQRLIFNAHQSQQFCQQLFSRCCAGAKDEVEIIDKFKTQAETKRRLVKLKEVVEIEKKDLEKKKEKLESELESIRFAQVKEKEQ